MKLQKYMEWLTWVCFDIWQVMDNFGMSYKVIFLNDTFSVYIFTDFLC